MGDAGCVDCHPDEAAKQAQTAHAATLRRMERSSLGDLAPMPGRVPGSDIDIREREDGRFTLGVHGEEGEPMELSFAVGSGKTGMTHVAMMEGDQLLELSRSYFPGRKKWYRTPGHQKERDDQIGIVYGAKQARECFLCHAVTVPSYGIAPSPGFYGVGCEACHGAGSVHAEAARNREPITGTIEKLGGWNPRKVNELCGRCHRTQQGIQMNTQQAGMTNRFQAYGLMKSACFKKSGEAISCVTCHDPHMDTSRDMRTYEAACLNCHDGAARATVSARSAKKSCPVNPKSGCIPCHMPSRPVFKNSDVPTKMADHLIKVYK